MRLGLTGLFVLAFGISAWLSFERAVIGRSILVPNLIGKSDEEARKIARDAGFDFSVERGRDRFDARVPAHSVASQAPEVGSFVKPGQTLRVILSKGPLALTIPDLAGMSARAAALALARASLQLAAVSSDRIAGKPAGICAQYPAALTAVRDGTPVSVLINRDPAPGAFVMPDLIGRDARREAERLARIGFKVGETRHEPYAGAAPETVLKQYPPAGYPVSPLDAITLTAASGGRT